MHDFFSPEQDRQLGSQLRREALSARRPAEYLPEKISLAVRNDDGTSHTDSHRLVSSSTIVYAVAAMLCVALALPALWGQFAVTPPAEQAKPNSLAIVDSVPEKQVAQVVIEPVEPESVLPNTVESSAISQLEPTEEDLALLTAGMQAAVDTLLVALPVDVDLDGLDLP